MDNTEINQMFYDGLYAPSGFDIVKALVRIANRPNPQIELGPMDCSAAIIVCDTYQKDTPIVYCSEAFTHLTGYEEHEIIGRNCRFLQSPCDNQEDGEPQSLTVAPAPVPSTNGNSLPKGTVDGSAEMIARQRGLLRLRSAMRQRSEVQVMVRNYTRSGTPFENLLTVIPVRWNSDADELRYMVGFQAKLPTCPARNPPGT